MVTDIPDTKAGDSLPAFARLPINRCNLPPNILGSLTFQQYPTDLLIDGLADLHASLYRHLDSQTNAKNRAQRFMDYMTVHFTLDKPEEAGANDDTKRQKADYLKLLRGWFFNSESQEAAVIKGWVESRFGLATRYHGGKIDAPDSPAYQAFTLARAQGLFNTNALESQLDLLYSFCQYEWSRRRPDQSHLTLYRGMNKEDDFDILERHDKNRATIILNSVNSFSKDPERAGEFGDIVLRAAIPRQKVLYHEGLLPGRLQGEAEYIVLGGVYRAYLSI